jgi:hypothetical protein
MPEEDPIIVNVSLVTAPVTVSMTFAAEQPITLALSMVSQPVSVTISEARDAYQLAVADGFIGTRSEWLASLQGEPGPAGDAPEIVVLTLAAYLALSPEVQMDGRWYLIPKS